MKLDAKAVQSINLPAGKNGPLCLGPRSERLRLADPE